MVGPCVVGAAVGEIVGSWVGNMLGEAVGRAVGDGVGEGVGMGDGEMLGGEVGADELGLWVGAVVGRHMPTLFTSEHICRPIIRSRPTSVNLLPSGGKKNRPPSCCPAKTSPSVVFQSDERMRAFRSKHCLVCTIPVGWG